MNFFKSAFSTFSTFKKERILTNEENEEYGDVNDDDSFSLITEDSGTKYF